MKIQRATFLGVRGVPDVTLDLIDYRTGAPPSVVVISGPHASGKTRLLEALIAAKEAIGSYGPMTSGASWISSGSAAKVIVTFLLDAAEQEYAGTSSPSLEGEVIFLPDRAKSEADEGLRAVLERYSHDSAQGKLEYFPATRRLPANAPFGGLSVAEQRIGRAGKDPRKYSFIVPFLRGLEYERAQAERFATRLAALSPSLRYVPNASTDAIPRCLSSRGGAPVTAAEISDSEADAVIFAATATLIGLDHSIVLVDRPALYLDDLGSLVDGLSALGQDNQLFLAVRPAFVAAVGGAHVVTLKGA